MASNISTVVEHLTSDPKIKDLNSAGNFSPGEDGKERGVFR
jgi:hypothetical protein